MVDGVKTIKIKAKRAFVKTKLPDVDYVINQYVGCQYACKYCYAKFMQKFYKISLPWGKWVIVKENIPELVKREKVNGKVLMSSVSDPYQPIERELNLTREILKNMDKSVKLSILTKSDLLLRDIDLLKEFKEIEVGLTINSFGLKIKREIEPYSPSVERRIKALKNYIRKG